MRGPKVCRWIPVSAPQNHPSAADSGGFEVPPDAYALWRFSYLMDHASDSPECQTCGACCFSGALRYVRVTGADYARLGDRAEALVHFIGNQAFMRMLTYHCAALEFDDHTGRFSCSAYEERPAACRELQSGSSACHGEKTAKAELVQLTIARRAIATPRETL